MKRGAFACGPAIFVAAGVGMCHASNALGQGLATWDVRYKTADGDDKIDPDHGEDNIDISLWIDLKPSPGQILADGSTVVGFGSVIADIVGRAGRAWDSGVVTWTMNPDLIFFTGDLTTKDDATQDLHNINAGQIPDFGPFSSADPIWIMTINWKTDGFSSRLVLANLLAQDNSIQAYVRKPGASFAEPQTWPFPGGDHYIGFEVQFIPSSGPGIVGVMAGAIGIGRRGPRRG